MAEIIKPVRCFTCGKVLPHRVYEKLLESGKTSEEAFKILRLKRYCCTARLMNAPVHATREVYANREVAKNLIPPPLEMIGYNTSSLPPM